MITFHDIIFNFLILYSLIDRKIVLMLQEENSLPSTPLFTTGIILAVLREEYSRLVFWDILITMTITPTRICRPIYWTRSVDVSFSSAVGGFMNERNNRTSKDVTQVKVIGSVGRDYELKDLFYLATKCRFLTLFAIYASRAPYLFKFLINKRRGWFAYNLPISTHIFIDRQY